MKYIPTPRLLALLLAAAFAAAPAVAKKDDEKHNQKHEHKGKSSVNDRDDVGHGTNHARKPLQAGAYFNDRNRESVRKYYATHNGKSCPPGLAKKNNGCLPPGQAKKQWAVGQPLPATVVLAPVPQQIIVTLPPVPPGHKYVQLAGDVLLIAAGSMMVVDGINGLMSH